MLNQARLLRAVIENTPGSIFVKSGVDRRYILVNRSTTQLYGKTEEEIIGHHDSDFFPPEAVKAMAKKDQQAIDNGGAQVNQASALLQ